MTRTAYFQSRYADKIARGECTRNGCKLPAMEGRTLCEKHRRRSQEYANTVAKFRRAGVEVPA